MDLAQNADPNLPPWAKAIEAARTGCWDQRGRCAPWLASQIQTRWSPTGSDLRLSAGVSCAGSAVLALGVAGSMTGTPPSWSVCGWLHVDVLQPTVYVPIRGGVLTPWVPIRFVDREVWMQAAWFDIRARGTKLTNAVRQGVFAPLPGALHFEMFGSGNQGSVVPGGGPLYRFTR